MAKRFCNGISSVLSAHFTASGICLLADPICCCDSRANADCPSYAVAKFKSVRSVPRSGADWIGGGSTMNGMHVSRSGTGRKGRRQINRMLVGMPHPLYLYLQNFRNLSFPLEKKHTFLPLPLLPFSIYRPRTSGVENHVEIPFAGSFHVSCRRFNRKQIRARHLGKHF